MSPGSSVCLQSPEVDQDWRSKVVPLSALGPISETNRTAGLVTFLSLWCHQQGSHTPRFAPGSKDIPRLHTGTVSLSHILSITASYEDRTDLGRAIVVRNVWLSLNHHSKKTLLLSLLTAKLSGKQGRPSKQGTSLRRNKGYCPIIPGGWAIIATTCGA